ncbi:MAG: methyltransferase domain-containing protein [Desulfovibrionaceae bacterium]|nr:methyltransferase domain-containing protein [Desulfovibrionaceae bacterium]MBF0512671.1 methyltransferase domain-containing protein [Desulfovibrionaceae bacterium]
MRQEIESSVQKMYCAHPFPPKCRRGTYVMYGEFIRGLFAEKGESLAGKRILDAGCGTGAMLCDIARAIPEATFLGVDLTPASLQIAREYVAEKGLTNVDFLQASVLDYKADAPFDMAYSWGVLHHTADPEAAFANVAAQVKPGGFIRVGVYGLYGNIERNMHRKLIAEFIDDRFNFAEKIKVVREWIDGDPLIKHRTEPPVRIDDDDWVVDEFLNVHERHIQLAELGQWFENAGFELLRLTDYYNQDIPLDAAAYSANPGFIERFRALPRHKRLEVVDILAKPYWLSPVGRKR